MDPLIRLRKALAEPRLRAVDVNGAQRISVHREILREKRLLRGVFEEFYRTCRQLDQRFFAGEGKRIEIGSGAGLFREYYADVLLSDIVPAEHLDLVLDAEKMALHDASVRAFYLIDCFHHLRDPAAFFRELQRVLVPGGGCVLIEPYYGPGARAFFRRLHDTERFDTAQEGWSNPDGDAGVMTGANQALSYIVFRRDVQRFHAEHAGLEIVYQRRVGNYLRYLCSGGLNFRQLLPGCFTPVLRLVERILTPLDHFWSLHFVVVLRKKTNEARQTGWGRAI
jgi:SAM-dependent methyltransferase